MRVDHLRERARVGAKGHAHDGLEPELADELLGAVPLGDVGNLVPEHTDDLGFVVELLLAFTFLAPGRVRAAGGEQDQGKRPK